MSTQAKTMTDKDIAFRFLEIVNTGEFAKLDEVLTEDVVIEWPQSRERVRGVENARAVFSEYPGGLTSESDRVVFAQGDEGQYLLTPLFTVVQTEGAKDFFTAVMKTRYPDGSDWYVIVMLKTRDGKIAKAVNYFAPTYDAPAWRSSWVERMEE